MFPIKYIDNNLVWNKDNEVFAYYELIPYNYSFLSAEQKFIVHDSFRQLIAQSREGKIHALQIATESSIRSMQEQSKKLVTGKLKEVAYQKIDEQTEALVSMIGDNQVDYRFFLGFIIFQNHSEDYFAPSHFFFKLSSRHIDRKSTRLNSSHMSESRMPSSA